MDAVQRTDSGGRAMEKAHLPFGRWWRAKGGEGGRYVLARRAVVVGL